MSLTQDIKDVIYEEVPLNLTCPLCEGEIDASSVIDTGTDKDSWERLAIKVIALVAGGIANSLTNISDREIEKL